MATAIQIRDVPTDVRRTLEARAALAGLSLTDYCLRLINDVSARPPHDEIMARLRALPPVIPAESVTDIIRADRDGL